MRRIGLSSSDRPDARLVEDLVQAGRRISLAPEQGGGPVDERCARWLLMTADRGQAQSVERARQYQTLIPHSRLVVVQSDGYHIAASNADECVTNVLALIKEAGKKA